MANFSVAVDSLHISAQIANMLNKYNRWYIKFNANSLMISEGNYFIEIYGSTVVGCASYLKETDILSKIQHICVLPEFRGKGIAQKLTETAIYHSLTEHVYMTIREDNIASLRLSQALGFHYMRKHWFKDHWTLTFGRERVNVQQQRQKMFS